MKLHEAPPQWNIWFNLHPKHWASLNFQPYSLITGFSHFRTHQRRWFYPTRQGALDRAALIVVFVEDLLLSVCVYFQFDKFSWLNIISKFSLSLYLPSCFFFWWGSVSKLCTGSFPSGSRISASVRTCLTWEAQRLNILVSRACCQGQWEC